MCTVMAFLFTSCGKSAAKKDHVSHQVNSNTNVSESEFSNADASVVYFTADISAEGLIKIYEQLGWQPTGKVAVKISTGEPPASNYLRPELIGDLVQQLHGTIVECNTAYGGSRSSSALVLDGMKQHLKEDVVGSHFANYDDYLILSHFKGHAMAGFGGAIKNISIGIASSKGKSLIHTGSKSTSNIWGGNQTDFTESMAKAGKAVSDYLGNGERIVYINVMNRLSVDCDCDGNPAEPDIHDIGILASFNPVALDQACVDLVYNAEGNASLVRRIESRKGIHTLEHAEAIGLGSRSYKLLNIDKE